MTFSISQRKWNLEIKIKLFNKGTNHVLEFYINYWKFTFSIVMPGNGNRDTWHHCRKGVEPHHVTQVALFTFSTAMLLALFHCLKWTSSLGYLFFLNNTVGIGWMTVVLPWNFIRMTETFFSHRKVALKQTFFWNRYSLHSCFFMRCLMYTKLNSKGLFRE